MPPVSQLNALRDVQSFGRWQGIRRTAITMVALSLAIAFDELVNPGGPDAAWLGDGTRWLGLLVSVLILRFALLLAIRGHTAGRDAARWPGLAAAVVALGLLLLHGWVETPLPEPNLAVAGTVGFGLELVIVLIGLSVVLGHPRRLGRAEEKVRDLDLKAPEMPPVDPGRSVVCFSGGGVRAAAFALGGMQGLTADKGVYDSIQRIYAVSGGSYLAASMATLSSGPDANGVPRTRPEHQDRPFQRASAEESRLRRNTFYLLGSPATAVLGLLHILYGLLLNVALVLSVMYLLAWWSGQTFGHLGILQRLAPHGIPKAWRAGGAWPQIPGWIVWSLLGLVIAVFVTFALARLSETLVHPANRFSQFLLQRVTGHLVAASAAVAVLGFAIPLLIAGLSNATVENRPTVGVAKVLYTLNAADERACVAGLQQDYASERRATILAASEAGTTSPRKFTFGACGSEFTARTAASGYQAGADELTGEQLSVEADGSHVGGLVAFLAAVATLIQSLFHGTEERKEGQWYTKLWAKVRGLVLPWLAITVVGLAALLTVLVWTRMFATDAPDPLSIRPPVRVGGLLLVLAVVHLLLDANRGSLYPFYRERLSRAFLVERRHASWSRGAEEDLADVQVGSIDVSRPVTFDLYPGMPEVMVCASANADDRGLIPPMRGCVPFVFSRDRMGVSDDSLPFPSRMVSSRRYADYERDDTTLGAAIAISGAAFSPIMGRKTKQAAAFRVLMALANARLGVWLQNPYWIPEQGAPPGRLQRILARPGAFRLVVEAVGRPSLLDGRLYVTDGGHFDNIALVEALRPRRIPGSEDEWEPMPSRVFVLDASADVENTFDALAEAVSTVRMDLGLSVHVPDTAPLESTATGADGGPALAQEAWLKAAVHDRTGRPTGTTVYFGKAIAFQRMSRDLRTYLTAHPQFPRTTTTNQFYGEFDFEAYRQLGQLVGAGMLESLQRNG